MTDPKWNHHWFRKLVTGKPHYVIGDPPYLYRRFLIPRNPLFNIYLHKFVRSDDDRAMHDHPWSHCSILIKGGYIEHIGNGSVEVSKNVRRAPSIGKWHPPTHTHRVELFREYSGRSLPLRHRELPSWSIFLTGPKVRNWGFHCPRGWIPWQMFTAPTGNSNKRGLGCGEYGELEDWGKNEKSRIV